MERLTGLAILLAQLLFAASVAAAETNAPVESFRVASYNLRNYLTMDRLVEGQYRLDYPKPETEKTVVRNIIRLASPDILVVQEIGSTAMLRELQADLAREGLVYGEAFVLEADDDTRRLGALWRTGLRIDAVGHTDMDFPLFDTRYRVKRGMLELRLRGGEGGDVSFFVLHLKSRYTDDRRDPESQERRTKEARAARNRILERFPDPGSARFAILGDLNDRRNSSPVRRFLQRGEIEISRVLECRDPHGLIWTHFYEKGGSYSLIDYILVSPGLLATAEVSGGIAHSEDYYEGSDHRLVWADFEL